MIRFGSFILCASLGLGLSACGSNSSSSGKGFTDLFPRSGSSAFSGWTVDPSVPKTSGVVAATATDEANTETLIDGAAADFFAAPSTPVEFGWQNYVNTTFPEAPQGAKLLLYILQMPNPDQASALYSALLKASHYSAYQWTDPSSPLVGDGSRVVDEGDTWVINFHKGVYYGEVWLNPSYGTDLVPDNPNLRSAAFTFANAIAQGM